MGVIEEIAAERKRQIEVEGWTADHDDEHAIGEIAQAAGCYAFASALDVADRRTMEDFGDAGTPYWLKKLWPWAREWWKPTSRRRDLIKAAALIVAEIERLDRATPSQEQGEG